MLRGWNPTTNTSYVYAGTDVAFTRVADSTNVGSVTHRYMYGPGFTPGAVDRVLTDESVNPSTGVSTSTRYMVSDMEGTVRRLVTTSGADAADFHYDSFGNVAAGSPTPASADLLFGYMGGQYDGETGLVKMGRRYNDTFIGQFISEDPLGFAAGDPNLRRFVGNDPVNATDPTGLLEAVLGGNGGVNLPFGLPSLAGGYNAGADFTGGLTAFNPLSTANIYAAFQNFGGSPAASVPQSAEEYLNNGGSLADIFGAGGYAATAIPELTPEEFLTGAATATASPGALNLNPASITSAASPLGNLAVSESDALTDFSVPVPPGPPTNFADRITAIATGQVAPYSQPSYEELHGVPSVQTIGSGQGLGTQLFGDVPWYAGRGTGLARTLLDSIAPPVEPSVRFNYPDNTSAIVPNGLPSNFAMAGQAATLLPFMKGPSAPRSGLSAADSWGRPGTLEKHFLDHGADFGATSAENYAQQASRFLQESQARGLPTKIGPDGAIRVYDPSTNTFGAYNANGTTRTFYQPNPAQHGYPTNLDYWNAQAGGVPWSP